MCWSLNPDVFRYEHEEPFNHFGACLFAAVTLLAQNYTMDWHKISGGGGTSTGGTFQVSGTIGQHDAGGPMTGGNYSLTGGFWALISVVQTSGAPTLFISHAGNSVIITGRMFPAGI